MHLVKSRYYGYSLLCPLKKPYIKSLIAIIKYYFFTITKVTLYLNFNFSKHNFTKCPFHIKQIVSLLERSLHFCSVSITYLQNFCIGFFLYSIKHIRYFSIRFHNNTILCTNNIWNTSMILFLFYS